MSQFDRSELVYLAEMCYKDLRYEDVISYMKGVIKMKTPRNFEERNMIFYSFTYLKQPFLRSYVYFNDSGVDQKLQKVIKKKAKIEINRICNEIFEFLDSTCIKIDTNTEAIDL